MLTICRARVVHSNVAEQPTRRDGFGTGVASAEPSTTGRQSRCAARRSVAVSWQSAQGVAGCVRNAQLEIRVVFPSFIDESDAIDIACGNGGVHSSLSRAIRIAQGREAAGGTGNVLAGEFLLQ